jgi:hypothetical protein
MSARTSGGVEKQPLYTTKDYRAMPAAERLEKINEQDQAAREAEAAANAKTKTDFTPEHLARMTPSARLELANDMQRFGEKPEPKPLSPEAVRKLDALRRLDFVNAQTEASRKAAKALGRRLAQVRKDSA